MNSNLYAKGENVSSGDTDVSTPYIPDDDAKRICAEFIADLRKRQLSSSENFDRSILTYSSGGLAVSLAFLKDFIPIGTAKASWMLYASWALFTIAVISVIISFLVSYKAQEEMQQTAERYYIQGDQSALTDNNLLNLVTEYLNYISGAAFIFALIFTTVFVSINLSKADKMKNVQQTLVYDGMPTALMPKIGNADLQKGLPTGNLQKIPPTSQQTPAVPSTVPTTQTGK